MSERESTSAPQSGSYEARLAADRLFPTRRTIPAVKRLAKESIEALDRAIAAIDRDPVVTHLADAARLMAKAARADSKQEENQDPELQLMKEQVVDIYEQAVLLGGADERCSSTKKCSR